MKKLTQRQQLFTEEYLVDLNATQAAVRAGYSPKTAQEQGSRLLCNVMVAAAVAASYQEKLQAVEARAKNAVMDRHEQLEKDTAIARSNLFDFTERVGTSGIVWNDFSDLPRELLEVVQELSIDPDKGTVKIKLYSKHPAFERLSKRSEPEPRAGDPMTCEPEEDDRDDGQRLRDFIGEVRMLAAQRGCLESTVQAFIDNVEQFLDSAEVPRRLP